MEKKVNLKRNFYAFILVGLLGEILDSQHIDSFW